MRVNLKAGLPSRKFRHRPFMKLLRLVASAALFLFIAAFTFIQTRPTIYVIGDSTVRNSTGHGGPGQWGWGTFLIDNLDSSQFAVNNQAMAGRSTRTFTSEGRWDRVLQMLKPGDYVFMQFGHNDGSVPDTSKAGNRGTLKGTGDETKELTYADGRKEIVHTYGWYLKKFIREAKAKGATPVVCSMIPRNEWKDGKVIRATNNFGIWAAEAAKAEGASFIDLNKITADKYDELGAEKVKEYFPGDHTHTNEAGARLNAASVVDGIKQLQLPIAKAIKQ
jgi:rhamnogalacturonan acetylesterase